jgi:hypothetical protein
MSLPFYRPRGVVRETRATRVSIAQSDVDGGVQTETFSGDIDQMDGTDFYEPPGLAETPASASEGVRIPGDPDPMILPRGARHSTTPNPPAGGAVLYGPAGGYAYFDANGDMIVEPAAGRAVKLGSGAAQAVAINGDPVARNAAMQVWMAAVTIATGVPALVGSNIGTVLASTTKARAE